MAFKAAISAQQDGIDVDAVLARRTCRPALRVSQQREPVDAGRRLST
jgi:hypothetical protein